MTNYFDIFGVYGYLMRNYFNIFREVWYLTTNYFEMLGGGGGILPYNELL